MTEAPIDTLLLILVCAGERWNTSTFSLHKLTYMYWQKGPRNTVKYRVCQTIENNFFVVLGLGGVCGGGFLFVCLVGQFWKLSYFFTRIRRLVFCCSSVSFTLPRSCLLMYLHCREYPFHQAVSSRLSALHTDIFAPCKHRYYEQLCSTYLSDCIRSAQFHFLAIGLILFW